MATNQTLQGIKLILLYRVLAKDKQTAAWKLAFQTEHTFSKSRDSDTTVTKDGPVIKLGEIEYELSATSIMAVNDPNIDELSTAFDDGEVMEAWIINKAEKGTGDNAEKFKAEYVNAYLTNYEPSASAEDDVELSLEFGVFGKAQKGYATLTDEQAAAVQYAFRDTVKATEDEGE